MPSAAMRIEDGPTPQEYFRLANDVCEVFYNPTLDTDAKIEQLAPIMEQLRRLVSIDHAQRHYRDREVGDRERARDPGRSV